MSRTDQAAAQALVTVPGRASKRVSARPTTPAGRRHGVALSTTVALLALGFALVMPASASATIVERSAYEGTDSFTYDFCGFVVEVDVTFHGVASVRAGKGPLDTAFFVHDKYWYTETHSANGKFFTISGNGLFQETKAVPLGDNLFEFTAVDAGQPFVVRGMDGEVLIRDRGSIRGTVIFDTLGDDEPGGVFVEELEFRLNGPHPGFFVDPTEACPLLAPDPA